VGKSAVLVLAGRDDGKGMELKALCFDLGICDTVRFPGAVKDVPGLLQASDIGAFSSPSEGCPNGVLECMAMGLPVVGSDIPGVREALGSEEPRALVARNDEEAMATKLAPLLVDPELRCELGERNRQRIRDQFSYSRMCDEMVGLLSR
jgi:glycosyltransferase involved in cell wall biosynthesis